MSIFFRVLSAAYIAGIFLLADSPMVSDVAPFNPYSLLHIPLYGILTLLLVFSFRRSKKKLINTSNSSNPINSTNLSREMRPAPCSMKTGVSGSLFHWDSTNLLVAGSIALVVAVADEIHQAYLPTRNASVIDVFLDAMGIILSLLIIRQVKYLSWFFKKVG